MDTTGTDSAPIFEETTGTEIEDEDILEKEEDEESSDPELVPV